MNLSEFCETNDPWHPAFRMPFSQDHYSYATDGKIAVRVDLVAGLPNLNEIEDRSDLFCPPVMSLLPWDHDRLTEEWVPMPKLPPDSKRVRKCGFCNGRGKLRDETCEQCDGEGVITRYRRITWERGIVNSYYLEKLSCLQNVEFNVHGEPDGIIRFRFDGGLGLLMPMIDNGYCDPGSWRDEVDIQGKESEKNGLP